MKSSNIFFSRWTQSNIIHPRLHILNLSNLAFIKLSFAAKAPTICPRLHRKNEVKFHSTQPRCSRKPNDDDLWADTKNSSHSFRFLPARCTICAIEELTDHTIRGIPWCVALKCICPRCPFCLHLIPGAKDSTHYGGLPDVLFLESMHSFLTWKVGYYSISFKGIKCIIF